MSDPFIAEIKIFAGNFAPRMYSFCNGALLPIAQNTALFSLIGTTYGGDGRQTLGLPNLQGRAPMHPGRGPGLSVYKIGQTGGTPSVTLNTQQMPNHNHGIAAANEDGGSNSPADAVTAKTENNQRLYHAESGESLVPMSQTAIVSNGNSQAHNNLQPYLGVYFIIALQGQYPSRS